MAGVVGVTPKGHTLRVLYAMAKGKAEFMGGTSNEQGDRTPYDPLQFEVMQNPQAAIEKYWGKQDGRSS